MFFSTHSPLGLPLLKTGDSILPAAQAKPEKSSSTPLSLSLNISFLSKSVQIYLRNTPKTQPLTTTAELLGDHRDFVIDLLTQPPLFARLGSWCDPRTKSGQTESLRIKSIHCLGLTRPPVIFLDTSCTAILSRAHSIPATGVAFQFLKCNDHALASGSWQGLFCPLK